MQLTTHLLTLGGEKRWVLASFDEEGNARYSDATPAGDLYAPVPDVYKTYEGAAAALAVVNAWTDDQALEDLRGTEEWAALEAHFADASIAYCTEEDFPDDEEAYEHYEAMVDAGVVERDAPDEDEDEGEEDEEAVEDELAEGEGAADEDK